jgi:mono/diheme cytochrome c family protein
MNWFTRLGAATRSILAAIALVLIAAVAYGLWLVSDPGPFEFARGHTVALADYHGANPTGVPSELTQARLIKRGEYLTRAADCTACHTAKGGTPFAGGLAFPLPFGTIYSPNITADRDTGIGNWSDAQFLNALHRGIDDEGQRLYPAMPYASYTYMTDADALAIKAYLFSLKPVHQENPENALRFPFNQRWLMGLWSMFFNADRRFEPNTAQSAEWNRGAYLSEALAHCGECHTPRNLAFALNNRKKFGGALTAGWRAYNISGDGATGVGAWSNSELEQYLATGHAEGRGTASGPMGEAVDASFRHLVPGDIHAIVTYLRTVPAVSGDLPAKLAGPASASPREPEVSDARGKMLFAGACAGCHSWTGKSPIWTQATLTGARAVNDPTAINVAQIVVEGASHKTQGGTVFMPAFGSSFSDAEIAAVANYVTARFGSQGSTITARDVATLRKQAAR